MRYLNKFILSLMVFTLSSVAVASNEVPVTALVGGSIVNLSGGKAISDAVVLIEDERIVAVGSAADVAIPSGVQVVDVGGAWLIPGLMNMHVHLGLVLPGNMATELANETEGELILRMAQNARKTLQAGVTTIRIPGERLHADLALNRAIEKQQVIGPRIFSAGEPIVVTGGHGSEPGIEFNDGPYEVMKAARLEISSGASWIKIFISGGIATNGGDISQALMTTEEINAAVDAAHRFGAKIAAHSGSPQATNVAVDAGVDSIEHGYFLDRQVLKKMAKAGTWLVPTIVVSQPATQPFFEALGSPQWYLERRDSVGKDHWKALQTAIEEGVRIGLGTDQMAFEPNDGTTATAREAQYYVEAGMTPLQALRSATIETARMLGAENEIGSIEVGKYADIVALASDPTDDIKALRNIQLVMKGGQIYRNDLD